GGLREVRLVGHVDGADRKELLEVRGVAADAIREVFLADADVAATLLGPGPPRALLVREREIEERARDVGHPAHERGLHAVADDREEADVLAGAADRTRHAAALGLGAGEQGRDVDDGHHGHPRLFYHEGSVAATPLTRRACSSRRAA